MSSADMYNNRFFKRRTKYHKRLGCDVRGFEPFVNTSLPEIPESIRDCIFNIDCGESIKHIEKYDLVMCIEVAEHIKENKADNLVSNLCNFADNFILFTAAGVGQRGKGHINCQPKQYWIDKFSDNDFYLHVEKTTEIKKMFLDIDSKLSNSLAENLMIFV
jgi:hypothetical protein